MKRPRVSPLRRALKGFSQTVRGHRDEAPSVHLKDVLDSGVIDCQVRRHERGAPIIEAKDAKSVWYGLGFAMGRDRYFQMDLSRRIAFGQLSELFGDIPLPKEARVFNATRMSDLDLFFRSFRFEDESRRQADALEGTRRDELEAFVAGINHALNEESLPPEYMLLGAPRPWTLHETIGLAFAFALMLDIGSLEHEFLINNMIYAGKSVLGQAIYATTGVRFPDFDELQEISAPRTPKNGGGSNAWAVSGARTASGKPILASDPHLPLLPIPSMWYHAILRCDDFEISGQTFAGTPSFPIGHNGHAAWGATATQRDAFDITRIIVANDDSVWRGPDGWHATTRHEVRIPRRFGPDRVAAFHTCAHGTIFHNWKSLGDTSLALRMAGARHEDHMRTIDAKAWFDGMNMIIRSRSWKEHREGLRLMSEGGLGIHHIYADADGTIAHQSYGLFPRRSDDQGVVPRNSWEEDAEWEEYLDFDELPCSVNPECGFVLSANAAPSLEVGGEWPYMAAVYEPPWRYNTLRAILEKNDAVDVELCRRMQMVTFCGPGPAFRDALLDAIAPRSTQHRAAAELLRAWDGTYERNSAAATIIENVMRRGAKRLWVELLGEKNGGRFILSRLATRRFVECVTDPEDALHAQLDAQGVSLQSVLTATFEETCAALQRAAGPAPEGWQLEKLQQVNLAHPLSFAPGLGKLFDLGSFPVGGGEYTPLAHAAGVSRDRLTVGIGPTSRFVCDLAAPEHGHWAQVTGASGRPRTRYFDSTTESWLKGELYGVKLR